MVRTLSAIGLLFLAFHAANAAERCPACLPLSGDDPVISPNDLQLHELNSEIRGHVVGPDGEPVEKVEVRLHISNDTAVTARDGSFRFSGLPPGTTELSIDDKRFLPVALPVSAPARDVEVRLTAGSVVRGRLLGCAACVDVMVNARQGRSLRSGWADAEGRYQISQLVPGLVEIETAQERRSPVQMSVVVPPGVPEVRLDIDLPPAFPVSGWVTGADGKPAPGALIVSRRSAEPSRLEDSAAPDGSFTLDLEAGRYTIAAARQRGEAFTTLAEEIAVDGPVDGLDIRLEPTIPLRGKVSGPRPGDTVRSLTARSLDGKEESFFTGDLDPEGGYEFSALKAGTWEVTAVWSDQESVSRRLTIPEGAAEASLDLEFSRGAETLLVHSKGGDWLCSVRLLGDGGREIDPPYDPAGEARFTALPAGTYKLQAVLGPSPSHGQDRQVLLERTVSIPETGELTLDLTAVCPRRDRKPLSP